MEGMLRVTPEKLISSSEEFAGTGNEMHSLTDEMLSLINSLNGVWIGDAANAYNTKFNSLQTDMEKLYRMVAEHSRDLSEMASSYAQAESTNTESGSALKANVIV